VKNARVTKLDNQPAPAWEAAKRQLLALADGEAVSLSAGEDAWLIVLHIEALGYLVAGCGDGEKDFHTLIERVLGDEPVAAFDGGNTNIYPRYVFVSAPHMLKAVQTYYCTGARDTSCDWVLDRDAVYE
jgi:hypothetical protein